MVKDSIKGKMIDLPLIIEFILDQSIRIFVNVAAPIEVQLYSNSKYLLHLFGRIECPNQCLYVS